VLRQLRRRHARRANVPKLTVRELARRSGYAYGVISEPVENVDLAPTFAELAGTTMPSTVDGHSLVSLLDGRPARDWRTAALVEHHGPDTRAGDPDLPPPGSGNPTTYEAMCTRPATYVEYSTGEREYYDRTRDPNELHNLAARLPAATRARQHAALTALRNCHDAQACWAAGHLAP